MKEEEKSGERRGKAGKGAERMMPIWVWVGLILLVYGLIVAALGVYMAAGHEPGTVLSELHPSIWWGCIMTAVGLVFFVPNLVRYLRADGASPGEGRAAPPGSDRAGHPSK